jgi:hypothetical protein
LTSIVSSELVHYVENDRVEVIVSVAAVGIETRRNIFQGLEEAVQVHLGVLAAPHHVFIDDVVVRLRYVIICHVLELGKFLKLT